MLPEYLNRIEQALHAWRTRWPSCSGSALDALPENVSRQLDVYLERLMGSPPFFHPDWVAQMQAPPHPIAVLGYLAAMQINPNGYMPDGAGPALEMEQEAISWLAQMLHLPENAVGYLTSGGSSANLQALWAARSQNPAQGVACSRHAHVSIRRACELLAVPCHLLDTDDQGRMDVDHLEELLRRKDIGTVVATAGTTAIGAVDPIAAIQTLRDRYPFHLHVDAAWGGFFTMFAWANDERVPMADLRAIAAADTVTIDPHKRGLQPIGCGGILYRDPSVCAGLRRRSPYAEWPDDQFNPGEISLECSRPAAAACALWLTLQCLPLTVEGLGAWLSGGLDVTQQLYGLLANSTALQAYGRPQLDILALAPRRGLQRLSQLDAATMQVVRRAQSLEGPLHLGTIALEAEELARQFPGLQMDRPNARILRAVFMKPEQTARVARLHSLLEQACILAP